MADSPVRMLVKIGDPTTAANEAAVSASGELSVILAANDGVDIGDVGVADFAATLTDADDDLVAYGQTTLRTLNLLYGDDGTQWERLKTDGSGALDVNDTGGVLTAVELIDDAIFIDDTSTHATGTTKGMGIMAVAVPTDTAIAANDIGMPAMSLDRRLHVDADVLNAGTFVVQEDGAALTALELIDDTVVVLGTATYSEATSKGNLIGAVRNDTLAALADTDNEIAPIQVNASGAVYVAVTEGGGESVPSGEVAVRATAADVAVDATLNVDEAEAQGTTTKVRGFDASASVPIKAELQSVVDGTGTPRVTLFAQAGEPIQWRAPHRDYFEVAHPTNAGFDGWRVVITNKDSTDAADLYGTIYTES